MNKLVCDGRDDSQDVEMKSQTEDEELDNDDDEDDDDESESCEESKQAYWYEHPRYNRYWKHHRKVCNWFKQHYRVRRELEQQHSLNKWQQWYQAQIGSGVPYSHGRVDPTNYYAQYMNLYYQMYAWYTQQFSMGTGGHYPTHSNYTFPQHQFKVPTSPAPKTCHSSEGNLGRRRKRLESHNSRTSSRPGSRGSNHKSTQRKRKKKEKHKSKKERIVMHMGGEQLILESEEAGSGSDVTEEYEMEITDDMLQFFAASAKHRHLRDTQKLTDEKTGEEKRVPKEETFVELGEVEAGRNKASVLPPSERPGVKRTSEMKLLYGGGAAMIHGMETAMQLTFDRNCDIKQPKLWPHLPLNIKFD